MLIYYLLHSFCHASYSVAASAVIGYATIRLEYRDTILLICNINVGFQGRHAPLCPPVLRPLFNHGCNRSCAVEKKECDVVIIWSLSHSLASVLT